jgi:hypothetical protein
MRKQSTDNYDRFLLTGKSFLSQRKERKKKEKEEGEFWIAVDNFFSVVGFEGALVSDWSGQRGGECGHHATAYRYR